MKFYEVQYPFTNPPQNAAFPCAVLTTDNWDDMGYHTTWRVNLYRTADEKIIDSYVKILQLNPEDATKARESTQIESYFETLNDSYCSLGPDLEYYEKLKAAGPEIYESYFSALRDVVYIPGIAAKFEATEGFRKSLLRFSEAEKVFREAQSLFTDLKVESSFHFKFWCIVPGASGKHEVDFDFSDHATKLNRVTVIIGRNGTGKTQFLAQFARAMSGWSEEPQNTHGFSPQRPGFSKVIAVSYSVFDNFIRPPEDSRTFSYKYCGIRAPDVVTLGTPEGVVSIPTTGAGAQFLSSEEIKLRLIKARSLLQASGLENKWLSILSILLEGTFKLNREELENLSFYDRLSSGQRILVATITEIVAHIVPQSIVLFDEPEIHLHPEVFAALVRAFDLLLKEFDSYAIIATHSALLLQEIFSRQVRIFKRLDNSPIVAPLTIESFGENLTTITREVFAVEGEKHNFRSHLEELSNDRTIEEVRALFPAGLPLQAEAFLLALKAREEL